MLAHTRASSLFVCLLFGLAPTTMLVAQVGTAPVTSTVTTTTTTVTNTAATTTATITPSTTTTSSTAVLPSSTTTPTTTSTPTATTTTTTTTTTSTLTGVTSTPQARIIEWDLPAQADASPGAMVVDTQGWDKNRVWFVTRQGLAPDFAPTVYRIDLPNSFMKATAVWTSWKLSQSSLISGGIKTIKASRDRRYILARAINALERVDTQNCNVAAKTCHLDFWIDQDPTDTSDLTVDDQNNVFTTHAIAPVDTTPDGSYVQMLTPTGYGYANVTRWIVGGGAGSCAQDDMAPSGDGAPCLSGIAVHPYNQYLIYYSEPNGNNIAELNIRANTVRRWSLDALTAAVAAECTKNPSSSSCLASQSSISDPRQLHIDRFGKVWVVTGSGHLVSLDPCTNQMTAHEIPDSRGGDPFGVAPDDDVVGYTATDSNKVGVLFPHARSFPVNPGTPVSVTRTEPIQVTTNHDNSNTNSGCVGPNGKTVDAQITRKGDDTYIEAKIDTPNDSHFPLGISPAKAKAQGTFFYAVAENSHVDTSDPAHPIPLVDRFGFLRMPIREKIKHPRDDDDQDDGWSGDNSWHNWHGHHDDADDDDDGVPNQYDSPDQENAERGDSAPLLPGVSMDYPMTASTTTLALIATAEADDPLAQIGIDILDANGLLVAKSVPTVGVAVAQVPLPAAGNYTCRVHNYSTSPVNHTPTLIVREPRLP